MAQTDGPETPESLQRKIDETREKFRSEFDPEASGRYAGADVRRLMQEDALVAAYLEARHHAVGEALKMMDESLQWRKELRVNDITEDSVQRSFLEAGMHYFRGYDRDGHKLFWFRLKLQAKDGRTLQEKKRYLAFWLEGHARREPGSLLTVVFDMSQSGLANVDMDFLRFLITCFQVYYPRLLARIVIYELPWIMNAAWKMVKSWLGPDAIEKLKFVTRADVQDFIEADQLPAHMGGTDAFEYSYPPLPEDQFQAPMGEPGLGEGGDPEAKDLEEPQPRPSKVSPADEGGEVDPAHRARPSRRPTTWFSGSLLRFSPAHQLSFGQADGEQRCVLVLDNIAKNPVAYKVRTTAPEKYRVKPSSGALDQGSGLDILVSLHGGSRACPQDRFLVMAAEMEAGAAGTSQDLAQFWKEVPKAQVTEHRLQCQVLAAATPAHLPNNNNNNPYTDPTNGAAGQEDAHATLLKLLAGSRRLEQKMDRCLRVGSLLIVMVTLLTAIASCCLFGRRSGLGLF